MFSKSSLPISTKLSTKHPLVKGFPVCSDNGPFPLQRVDNQERVRIGCNVLKIFFSQNHWANFHQTWYKASFWDGLSSLCKWSASLSSKGEWKTGSWVNCFKNLFLQNHRANFNILVQSILWWRAFRFVQLKCSLTLKGR